MGGTTIVVPVGNSNPRFQSPTTGVPSPLGR